MVMIMSNGGSCMRVFWEASNACVIHLNSHIDLGIPRDSQLHQLNAICPPTPSRMPLSLISSHHTPTRLSPSLRRFHTNMLIRQPEHNLPIRTRAHIIPRIPLHHASPPFTGQPTHRPQLFRLHLHHTLRVPNNHVPLPSRATN